MNNRINITSSWFGNSCSTKSYSSGDSVDSSCTFSESSTLAFLKGVPAFCANFVREIHYTVYHSTATTATIDKVTATVVVSDIPNVESNTTQAPVSVSQVFSVRFSSADATEKNSDNGNLVAR